MKMLSVAGSNRTAPKLVVGVDRVVFPAQAVIDGQLLRYLPLIARVHRPVGKAQRVGILELRGFAGLARESRGGTAPTSWTGCRQLIAGPPFRDANVPSKPKVPRAVLKGSALRLEVVQRVFIVFEADAHVVRALDFGHVDDAGVLVVAELEGAARIGVSNVGDAGDLEARNAFVVRTDAVGARDVQHVVP